VTLARTLRPAGNGVLSALPPGDEGAPYDRRAAAYDRLVASPLYNRLLWRPSPRTYAAFAAEALHAGDGPLLDVACGSGVFTAAAYRHADRPLVLADRSLAMLGRARGRLGLAAPEVSFRASRSVRGRDRAARRRRTAGGQGRADAGSAGACPLSYDGAVARM
jgi:SAM-dependent methyltransferase